tara:strand:+ start:2079 stop:2279 length:201 start_codon:yes stop_codon:yes gene_type:complete
MVQKTNKKIEELKKIQDEILTLDLTDEVSAFQFSMLFLDMMTIIKEIETIDGDKSFICSDAEAGIA